MVWRNVLVLLRGLLYLKIGRINIGIDQLSLANLTSPTPPSRRVVNRIHLVHSFPVPQNTSNAARLLQGIEINVRLSGLTNNPQDQKI